MRWLIDDVFCEVMLIIEVPRCESADPVFPSNAGSSECVAEKTRRQAILGGSSPSRGLSLVDGKTERCCDDMGMTSVAELEDELSRPCPARLSGVIRPAPRFAKIPPGRLAINYALRRDGCYADT